MDTGNNDVVLSLVDLLPAARHRLPPVSPAKANETIIKTYREHLQRSPQVFSFDITGRTEWRQWVVHHREAQGICAAGICHAFVVRVMDEWDHNKNFQVVDLCLHCADGSHVRLHPNS